MPSLPEQRRIAAILDRADALRRKRQEAQALTDAFLRAAFLDLFGDPATNPKDWPETELSGIADVSGGLQLSGKRAGLPLRAPFLRVANVQRGFLTINELGELNCTEAEHRRTRLCVGDVLLVEGNGNPTEVGRAATWDGRLPDVVHQNHLIRVRPHPASLLPVVLEYMVNSRHGRRYFASEGVTTSGLSTISTGKVNRFRFPLPPLDLQKRFARVFHATQAERARMRAQAAEIDALVASLQAEAFG